MGGVWLLHQITNTRFCFDITHDTVTSLPPGKSTAVDLCARVTTHHHHQHLTHVTHQHHHIQGLRGGGVGGGDKSEDKEHLVLRSLCLI